MSNFRSSSGIEEVVYGPFDSSICAQARCERVQLPKAECWDMVAAYRFPVCVFGSTSGDGFPEQ